MASLRPWAQAPAQSVMLSAQQQRYLPFFQLVMSHKLCTSRSYYGRGRYMLFSVFGFFSPGL